MAAVLLVVVIGVSAVGAAQWYSNGGPQDFRSAVAYIADRAQPGDGVLIFAPYERIPVEWYMAQKPATERAVHPVYPATAWGVDPLYFDGGVPLPPAAVQTGRLDVPAHLARERHGRPLPCTRPQAAAVEAALRRAGFTPAGHAGLPRGDR